MKNVFYEARKDTRGRLFAEVQKQFPGRLHFHRAFEIAYILDGSASYTIENECFIAQPDHIVFAHCYYRHTGYADLPHRKYVIAVPENLSHEVIALFKDQTLPAHLPDAAFNKTLLPFFEALLNTNEDTSDIVIKGYVNLIFGLLAAHYKGIAVAPKSKNVSIIVDILNYIDKHCDESLTLDKIADHFGYNKSYFSHLFNKNVGVSLSHYINLAKLDRYELLAREQSDKSVTELAFKAGFQSLSTFYRVRQERAKKSSRI